MSAIRVLVVNAQPLDDSLLNKLKETGFQVEQRQQLPETAILLAQKPEVLLIEAVSLPINLLSEIKKSVTYSVIVVLNSSHDLDIKIDYLNAGADAYFERPVSPSVVLAHLLSLLRRKVSFNPHLLQKTTDSLEAPPSFFQRLLRKCPKKF